MAQADEIDNKYLQVMLFSVQKTLIVNVTF